jgi:hypothetical protein
MEEAIINILDDPGKIIPLVAIGGGLIFALLIITIGCITGVIKSRHREISRREIAAYIAEGSISADEGERLMRAAPPTSCSS